jgi:hypothetical protein
MDEDRDTIAEIAERTGLTEDEAHVHYHLDRARNLYRALPGRTNLLNTIRFDLSYKNMIDMLAERVLHRDRPEGWGMVYLDVEGNSPEDEQDR